MKIRKVLPALGALVLGATLGTLVSRPLGADSGTGAPVNIVSPLPVPVGITGQPTVLIKNLEEPGRVPYEETLLVSENAGQTGFCTVSCGTEISFSAVPANKRLVIKEVSIEFPVKTGGIVFGNLTGFIVGAGGGLCCRLSLPLALQFSFGGFDNWFTNQQVNLYVDAGEKPVVDVTVDVSHADQGRNVIATLTGYYVSLP